MALAIFPLEQYTGTYTTNLFQEDDETYFDDAEQFVDLQRAEVERRAEAYRETTGVEWVEVVEASYVPWYQYDQARKNARKYGVVIHLQAGTGRVEIRERLKRREMSPSTTSALSGSDRPKPSKPYYGPKLALEIGRHKTMAVQHRLFANRRKAREVAAVRMLVGWKTNQRMEIGKANAHPYISEAMRSDEPAPATLAFLEKQAHDLFMALYPEAEADSGIWELQTLSHSNYQDRAALDVYERVKRLDDETLDDLLTLLPILTFGEQTGDSLDVRESLFNRVAQDLAVDMKEHWRPDRTFLDARTKDQLLTVAQESGAADVLGTLPKKKGELVDKLATYFSGSPDERAKTWLPGAMQFPARDKGQPEPEPEPVEEGGDDE